MNISCIIDQKIDIELRKIVKIYINNSNLTNQVATNALQKMSTKSDLTNLKVGKFFDSKYIQN